MYGKGDIALSDTKVNIYISSIKMVNPAASEISGAVWYMYCQISRSPRKQIVAAGFRCLPSIVRSLKV